MTEQQDTTVTSADIDKAQTAQWIRVGEQRGRRLQIIWEYKLRAKILRDCGMGVDVPEGHGTDPRTPHDWISTGDPCWCGSDNCEVCLICLEENHD